MTSLGNERFLSRHIRYITARGSISIQPALTEVLRSGGEGLDSNNLANT